MPSGKARFTFGAAAFTPKRCRTENVCSERKLKYFRKTRKPKQTTRPSARTRRFLC